MQEEGEQLEHQEVIGVIMRGHKEMNQQEVGMMNHQEVGIMEHHHKTINKI